jgi:DNA-binding NarL/FixJ family response regulator
MAQPTTTLQLLLVDDHRYFRDGVRDCLQHVNDMNVAGEASDGAEAVEKALVLKPDIILMDLNMPRLSGIEATRKISHDLPSTGTIIMTMFEEIDSVLAAMRAGARGYILKSADEDELIRSIRAVANGEALFGSAIAKRLITYMAEIQPSSSAHVFPELTAREREVLALIAEERDNTNIAGALGLSLKTVRNHVSSILSKMQVIDRREAMVRARAAGLGGKTS